MAAAYLVKSHFNLTENSELQEKANMLRLTIHELRETIVFQCTGRIVFGQCDILRDAFLFHPHSPIAVLDMAEVTAVDAAGLGLLVELRNWACARRTQLRLLNVRPYLEKLLQITNLVRILDVCSVREMMDLYRAMHVVTIAAGNVAPSSAAARNGSIVSVRACDEMQAQLEKAPSVSWVPLLLRLLFSSTAPSSLGSGGEFSEGKKPESSVQVQEVKFGAQH